VKNIIKKHQIGVKESNQSNIKISNEFKYFIANVLKDFMLQLTRKIEVYFSDKIIKTAKEQDVIKILKLSI